MGAGVGDQMARWDVWRPPASLVRCRGDVACSKSIPSLCRPPTPRPHDLSLALNRNSWQLPVYPMAALASEAHRRGCTVALKASPLPLGVASYRKKAEALLQGSVDVAFFDEVRRVPAGYERATR